MNLSKWKNIIDSMETINGNEFHTIGNLDKVIVSQSSEEPCITFNIEDKEINTVVTFTILKNINHLAIVFSQDAIYYFDMDKDIEEPESFIQECYTGAKEEYIKLMYRLKNGNEEGNKLPSIIGLIHSFKDNYIPLTYIRILDIDLTKRIVDKNIAIIKILLDFGYSIDIFYYKDTQLSKFILHDDSSERVKIVRDIKPKEWEIKKGLRTVVEPLLFDSI